MLKPVANCNCPPAKVIFAVVGFPIWFALLKTVKPPPSTKPPKVGFAALKVRFPAPTFVNVPGPAIGVANVTLFEFRSMIAL